MCVFKRFKVKSNALMVLKSIVHIYGLWVIIYSKIRKFTLQRRVYPVIYRLTINKFLIFICTGLTLLIDYKKNKIVIVLNVVLCALYFIFC